MKIETVISGECLKMPNPVGDGWTKHTAEEDGIIIVLNEHEKIKGGLSISKRKLRRLMKELSIKRKELTG